MRMTPRMPYRKRYFPLGATSIDFARTRVISTWLFRIASNAALAVVRRRPEIADAEQVVSGRRDHAEGVVDAERVQVALLQLPEPFRVALVLRIYGDFTYEDIAAHQGIPVQTVKSRLSRARSLMQDLLGTTEPA